MPNKNLNIFHDIRAYDEAATQQFRQRNWPKCIEICQQMLEWIAVIENDHQDLESYQDLKAETYDFLASVYSKQENSEQALAYSDLAIQCYDNGEGPYQKLSFLIKKWDLILDSLDWKGLILSKFFKSKVFQPVLDHLQVVENYCDEMIQQGQDISHLTLALETRKINLFLVIKEFEKAKSEFLKIYPEAEKYRKGICGKEYYDRWANDRLSRILLTGIDVFLKLKDKKRVYELFDELLGDNFFQDNFLEDESFAKELLKDSVIQKKLSDYRKSQKLRDEFEDQFYHLFANERGDLLSYSNKSPEEIYEQALWHKNEPQNEAEKTKFWQEKHGACLDVLNQIKTWEESTFYKIRYATIKQTLYFVIAKINVEKLGSVEKALEVLEQGILDLADYKLIEFKLSLFIAKKDFTAALQTCEEALSLSQEKVQWLYKNFDKENDSAEKQIYFLSQAFVLHLQNENFELAYEAFQNLKRRDEDFLLNEHVLQEVLPVLEVLEKEDEFYDVIEKILLRKISTAATLKKMDVVKKHVKEERFLAILDRQKTRQARLKESKADPFVYAQDWPLVWSQILKLDWKKSFFFIKFDQKCPEFLIIDNYNVEIFELNDFGFSKKPFLLKEKKWLSEWGENENPVQNRLLKKKAAKTYFDKGFQFFPKITNHDTSRVAALFHDRYREQFQTNSLADQILYFVDEKYDFQYFPGNYFAFELIHPTTSHQIRLQIYDKSNRGKCKLYVLGTNRPMEFFESPMASLARLVEIGSEYVDVGYEFKWIYEKRDRQAEKKKLKAAAKALSVTDIWKNIESVLQDKAPQVLNDWNPPASQQEIQDLEKQIGKKLPEDFKEWLQLHNGQQDVGSWIVEFGYFLDTSEIFSNWQINNDVNEDYEPENKDDVWWHKRYLPFVGNGGGDSLAMDLKTGSIVKHYHDQGIITGGPDSFKEWLYTVWQVFEAGQFSVDDEGSLVF